LVSEAACLVSCALKPDAHNANAAEKRRKLTDTGHSQYFFLSMKILSGLHSSRR
jgi:hypothetical protein